MRDAVEDPAAVGAARGAGRQENSETNNATDASAPAAAPSATGDAIRRYLPELAALHRYVGWAYERKADAILSKVPRKPRRPNERASTDRPTQWGSLEDAVVACARGGLSGIGLVMTGINAEHPELRLIGIDLDKAFDELGALKPWARRIVHAAGPCYWERSPSGRGLRGFMRGAIPGEMSRKFNDPIDRPFAHDSGGIELYDGRSGRYLTVTGNRYVAS